jgi:hypothetical protein
MEHDPSSSKPQEDLSAEAAEAAARSARSDQERVEFYEELLQVERAVLARMEELAGARSEKLRAAVMATNIEPLRALINDFEERLRFWQQKASDGWEAKP